MSAWQILRIVWARRWLALTLFVLTVAAGIGITLVIPKLYTAEASLVFDVKVDPIVGVLAPNMAAPAYMATQIEILKSDRVAARVVKKLGLENSASAVDQWKEATERRIPLERYFGALLQRGLAVEPVRGSNIVNVLFSAQEPVFAATVANAFAQAYVDVSIDMRVEPARQYAGWFDEQSKVLRANLEQAQARLSKFQRDRGIIVSADQVDQESAKLGALNGQLLAAQAELVDAQGRQRNSGSELSPDVQQSPVVGGLKAQLAQAETKLGEISSIVGPNHPQRQQLVVQIGELKQQLGAEIRRVTGGSSVISKSSQQKVDELKTMVELQKKQVLTLRNERDAASVLMRDVETAQRAYESAGQRVSQLNLESQTNQASVRVLNPAIEPLLPSRPQFIKGLAASIVAGLLLGLGVVLGLEMLDRRVRSPEDLLAIEGVPVLGVLHQAGSKLPVYRRLALTGLTPQPALPMGAR